MTDISPLTVMVELRKTRLILLLTTICFTSSIINLQLQTYRIASELAVVKKELIEDHRGGLLYLNDRVVKLEADKNLSTFLSGRKVDER